QVRFLLFAVCLAVAFLLAIVGADLGKPPVASCWFGFLVVAILGAAIVWLLRRRFRILSRPLAAVPEASDADAPVGNDLAVVVLWSASLATVVGAAFLGRGVGWAYLELDRITSVLAIGYLLAIVVLWVPIGATSAGMPLVLGLDYRSTR